MEKKIVYSNPDAIAAACHELGEARIDRARKIISSEYPFDPGQVEADHRKGLTSEQRMRIFARDGFIDRYFGNRLYFAGALRILSFVIPEEFPYHPNWKRTEGHDAYWQLQATIDHVTPLSKGGRHEEENLVTTSQLHNGAKGNRSLKEMIGWKLVHGGRMEDWDGMIKWYIEYIDQNPKWLKNSTLSDYYRMAKRVLDK